MPVFDCFGYLSKIGKEKEIVELSWLRVSLCWDHHSLRIFSTFKVLQGGVLIFHSFSSFLQEIHAQSRSSSHQQKNKPRKQSELSRIDEHRIAKVVIAIVKATSYEDEPASEKHVHEIPTLTSSSRGYIHAFCQPCRSVCRLVHRLLNDGDPVFVNEISYATRRVSLPIGFHGRIVETVERQIDGRA
ncbi:hypothetical protein DVH24_025364 [Malus domestica]|uniref:AP180 N-terminal homology (ANTH) domain-containing protein n=1 Tax=Malus domestica TaxID=3750 RepID=A0A498HSK6_MALDO|nr:hypothetical protein DVH24_025364 [Malus domestica]